MLYTAIVSKRKQKALYSTFESRICKVHFESFNLPTEKFNTFSGIP